MLTYPKSTMRVRRMPMHLSSGHVTLMPGKILSLPSNFPQSDLGRRADSRWVLPQISSFLFLSFWQCSGRRHYHMFTECSCMSLKQIFLARYLEYLLMEFDHMFTTALTVFGARMNASNFGVKRSTVKVMVGLYMP